MKLVFIGAGHFGLRCLELVCGLPEVSVTGVVTAPPVFSISYRPTGVTNVLHAGVAGYAEAQGVPVAILQQRMNESGLLESVQTWQSDAFLVVGWYHMIPKAWRALAPAYGLHALLLTDYSGGAPLVWVMINGETKTGITLFQMDDGVDSGPIADQSKEPIHSTDTIATLYPRIEERGLELLRHALPALAAGTLTLRPQDENKRRIMPQRAPEDGRIDWAQDAIAIDRFVRAQTLWAERCESESQQETPGLVQKEGSISAVACAHGRFKLKEVTYGGRDYSQSQLPEPLGGGDRGWALSRAA